MGATAGKVGTSQMLTAIKVAMHCVHTALLQTKNLSQPKGAWECPAVLL